MSGLIKVQKLLFVLQEAVRLLGWGGAQEGLGTQGVEWGMGGGGGVGEVGADTVMVMGNLAGSTLGAIHLWSWGNRPSLQES